jgi:hypothetical protein
MLFKPVQINIPDLQKISNMNGIKKAYICRATVSYHLGGIQFIIEDNIGHFKSDQMVNQFWFIDSVESFLDYSSRRDNPEKTQVKHFMKKIFKRVE